MTSPSESSPTERLEMELELMRSEFRALRSRIEVLMHELDESGSRILAVEGQLERYRHQLRAVRLSLSWRLTQPLRIIKRRLRSSR